MMAELDDVREKLKKKLSIQTRRVNEIIRDKESSTLLPRRPAILPLAADTNISISRKATPEQLSQLRAVKTGAAPLVPSPAAAGSPAPRARSARAAPTKKVAAKRRQTVPRKGMDRKAVFVVHGRNVSVKKGLFSFLRSIDLKPLEWKKAIEGTRKTNPTIQEILGFAFSHAHAVVVLLTPDDDVQLRKEFRKPTDPPYEAVVVGQARPNVLFEAGMAMGRSPDPTLLVEGGDLKHFSDIGGRHVTRLGNDTERRGELIVKLKNAGCEVDDSGSDWYSEGDFS